MDQFDFSDSNRYPAVKSIALRATRIRRAKDTQIQPEIELNDASEQHLRQFFEDVSRYKRFFLVSQRYTLCSPVTYPTNTTTPLI